MITICSTVSSASSTSKSSCREADALSGLALSGVSPSEDDHPAHVDHVDPLSPCRLAGPREPKLGTADAPRRRDAARRRLEREPTRARCSTPSTSAQTSPSRCAIARRRKSRIPGSRRSCRCMFATTLEAIRSWGRALNISNVASSGCRWGACLRLSASAFSGRASPKRWGRMWETRSSLRLRTSST